MIIKEFYRTRNDGVSLYKTYSDQNMYITKEGLNFYYAFAIDVENAPFVYIETDKPIPEKPANFRMRKPVEVDGNAEQNN
jgi:hypothetical protein